MSLTSLSALASVSGFVKGNPSIDYYKVLGFSPELVADFDDEYYRANRQKTTFDGLLTHSRLSRATMVDSDGLIKWGPHNLLTYSEEFNNTPTWTHSNVVVDGTTGYLAPNGTLSADKITMGGSVGVNDGVYQTVNNVIGGVPHKYSFWVRADSPVTVYARIFNSSLASTFSITTEWQLVTHTEVMASSGTVYPLIRATNPNDEIYVWGAHLYRSDLGGMVNNPDTGNSYVPTTSSARYLPRRGHHVWNGSAWVNEGLLIETEARTNLLHTTNALVTQTITVTAVPHTLHFTGTGTVTLSGASTDGPLVGTGTGEQNRVSLTFTPTAGLLMLIVTGTVADAQLEVGSTPSSYIPNLAASGSVNRTPDILTIPSAKLPYSSSAMSIQMDGRVTGDTYTTTRWHLDANNYITQEINSSDFTFEQAASGTVDAVTGSSFTPGTFVPYNISSRHGSTFINGAVDGTALTADTTPVALPNLSSTDLSLAYDYMGTIRQFRVWAADLGDSGIAEASTNA